MSAVAGQPVAQQVLFIELPDETWQFVGKTFEDHVGCWQEVDGQVQKDKWKLGAIAASLDVKYDDKTVSRFAYETRRSARRVREYAQTYRTFPKMASRSPILSFHHHTVAARADDPIDAINRAEGGEWDCRGLEKWIKTGIEPGQELETAIIDETVVVQTEKAQEWLQAFYASVLPHTKNAPAPFLETLARSVAGAILHQSERTIEGDCRIIMDAIEENNGLSGDDLFDWHTQHFHFMSEEQLKERLALMIEKKELVEDDAGPDGRQAKRRGALPKWYAPFYVKRKKAEGAMCKKCDEWHRTPEDCLED